ncbi:MAG: DUF3526 domain-containing protein [Bacteroidetes bacterium]|nr:DUF3526 domain-containing protein [Bacteroidota bacterium]
MKKIIINELKIIKNQKIFVGYLIAIISLWVVATTISFKQYKGEEAVRNQFNNYHRQLWENQDPKNPHMAAHYGSFAFKPANSLSIFDNGINSYSGSFIYLEAHRQNDFICSPAQNSSIFLRLGELNLSFLFQIAIPLLILSLCVGMFNTEKSSDLISFISVNSFSTKKLLLYKSYALLLINSAIYVGLYALTVILTSIMGVQWALADLLSLTGLLFSQLVFSYILILLFLLIALKAKDIKQATIVSLSVWILLFFILPRIAVNVCNTLYPLPSNLAFKEEIKKDIDNGINGHGKGDREKLVIDSVLKANHVDSTYKLPVNIDGIMLFKGEEYSSIVYNKHFSDLKNVILKQQQTAEVISLFSPYLLIKNLSMSICKTDLRSEFNFREQAENYRYYFVQELNNNMKLKSKENEFNTYKIHKSDFLAIKDFHYQADHFYDVIKHSWLEIILIMGLLSFLLIMVKLKA